MSSTPRAKQSKIVKLTLFVHRKPDMSVEDFEQYWTHTHPKALARFNEKVGRPIVKYVQCHRNPSIPSQGNSTMADIFASENELERGYEAVVEVWFERFVSAYDANRC